jgi:acyl-coenzyme A thioesterase PaaI-like protein
MFTIKHIDKKNTEHLIEAVSVWYEDNSEEVAGMGAPVVKKLHYAVGTLVHGGYLTKTLDFGMVYVMNNNGKTVADYALGEE